MICPPLPAHVDGIGPVKWMLEAETTRVDAFARAGAEGWPWLAGSICQRVFKILTRSAMS